MSSLAIAGCDVTSTVGYNDRADGLGGPSCGPDAPIAACETGTCVVTDLFPAKMGADAIAVDGEAAFFLSEPNVLARRPFDAGPLVELATDLDQMQRFTVDDANVYWTEFDSLIRAVPKAGGEPFVVASPLGNLMTIAVDSQHVYAAAPDRSKIVMAPKSGGEEMQLADQADPQEIAVDASHVYWVNRGTGAADGQLVRAARGDLASADVIQSSLDAPVRLAVSGDAVYWASADTIWRVPKAGGTPAAIADGFAEVRALAPFGGILYVAHQGGLVRLPIGGGEVTVLDARPMSAMTLGCTGVYAAAWFEDVIVRYGP